MEKENTQHKIVSFSPYIKAAASAIEHLFPNVTQEYISLESTKKQKLTAVKNASILLGDFQQRNQIDRNIIKASTKLKLIQQPTVGIDAVDIKAASEFGVPVANAAGFNSVAVAEHSMMMMLALLRKLSRLHMETSKCNWLQLQLVNSGSLGELQGKTVGILGFGRSGRELARRANAFSANVIYNKRSQLSESEEKELGVKYCSFEDILSQSDILSVHVPLTVETRGMIGREEVALLKKGAIFLNLARGEVVDAEAIAEALERGDLSGAGFDVFDPEPIDSSNPLIGLENVILTPHIAGATAESKIKSLKICFDNFARVFRGETPINIVNS